MDPIGLLGAVVALAVYPGGLTLALLSRVVHVATGRPGPVASGWSRPSLLALAAAALATALLPLPGSPAGTLPPGTGPDANLLAIGLLLAAGGGALPGGLWVGRGRLAAGLVAAALVAIGAAAGSLSVGIVVSLPGTAYAIARGATGLALVALGLLLGRGRRRADDEGGRVALTVAGNLTGSYLVVGGALAGWPGPVASALVLALGGGAAILGLRLGRLLPGPVSEGVTAACAAVALVATLVAVR